MSERKGEREKKRGKKSFNRVCQLAFPFEKVIHLTAPKMPWENKGFRRQEALQHDLQGLSDVLCVYSWLLELLFVCRLNRLVRVFDKCLSRHECMTPEWNFIKAFRFVSFVNIRELLQRETTGMGIWNAFFVHRGCPSSLINKDSPCATGEPFLMN